jgi:hypothetical protein
MTYRFLDSSLTIKKSPKETFTSDFQNALSKDFKTSSDWFTIEREMPYGSGIYEDIDVRINRTFEGKIAVASSDDYKKLLFESPDDNPSLGSLFQFDSNYWIVHNIEAIKSLATTCVVRRCNNILRWKDFDTGVIYNQPCVVDYLIKETRDYSTGGSALVQPSGFLEVLCQFNSNSNKIRPNRRFLFGNLYNWNAFKIMGGGINNYNNLFTSNMMSTGILRLSMLANQVSDDTDDLTNGIADSSEYIYTVSLNKNTLSLTSGSSYNLLATVELNGQVVSKNINWSTSNSLAVTVSNGILTPISVGTSIIKAELSDNPLVYDDCHVTVTSVGTNNYVVVLSPNRDYLYQDEEQTFTTTLYLNGSAQGSTFTYSVNNNGVPAGKFDYSVLSGNTFKIKNLERHDGNPIYVIATSGATSLQIPIRLRGAW